MSDPLEERLRRLRPSALPDEVRENLTNPPARDFRDRKRIIRLCFGVAAAAAAVIAVFWPGAPSAVSSYPAPPVLADTATRRVEDARPLAVLSEGQRAWELVEVKWVDENTLTTTTGGPLAIQVSNTHRTIVPVEIVLD
jgi:hypothetical protein